jgi:hypothetical protein
MSYLPAHAAGVAPLALVPAMRMKPMKVKTKETMMMMMMMQ